ncbi:uncharacterized protein VTP21DRAFT_4491 [Calcarisporiella thermophila]|uniref:uncharacterized protein n=1 Tax=Calcarisporiella thermophila TaxID=911321 RepID=UPI0037437536
MPLSPPRPPTSPRQKYAALACLQCKRKRRICNGQRPCSHCDPQLNECIYPPYPDISHSQHSTSRRLSSGSACETCRRRKTKCDGGSPCGFCAMNGHTCVNNSDRLRRRALGQGSLDTDALEHRLLRLEKLVSHLVQPVVLRALEGYCTKPGLESHERQEAINAMMSLDASALMLRSKVEKPPLSSRPLATNTTAASSSSQKAPQLPENGVHHENGPTSSHEPYVTSSGTETQPAAYPSPPLPQTYAVNHVTPVSHPPPNQSPQNTSAHWMHPKPKYQPNTDAYKSEPSFSPTQGSSALSHNTASASITRTVAQASLPSSQAYASANAISAPSAPSAPSLNQTYHFPQRDDVPKRTGAVISSEPATLTVDMSRVPLTHKLREVWDETDQLSRTTFLIPSTSAPNSLPNFPRSHPTSISMQMPSVRESKMSITMAK